MRASRSKNEILIGTTLIFDYDAESSVTPTVLDVSADVARELVPVALRSEGDVLCSGEWPPWVVIITACLRKKLTWWRTAELTIPTEVIIAGGSNDDWIRAAMRQQQRIFNDIGASPTYGSARREAAYD